MFLRIAAGVFALALSTGTSLAQSTATAHPGRLLASNCFQCHGTNGRPTGDMERLAGKSASEIYDELQEMRNGGEDKGIMSMHAKGYTDQQLRQIADFFAKVK